MALYVGTAGYVYAHWRKGAFYPTGLRPDRELPHYLTHFNAVEINATFHAFPRSSVLSTWRTYAHPYVRFALKAPAVITHQKRLRDARDDIKAFMSVAQDALSDNLGPLLFQCPPSLSLSIPLLEGFLLDLEHVSRTSRCPRVAIEFRSADWFCPQVYSMLASRDIALVDNVVVSETDFSVLDDSAFPRVRSAAGEEHAVASWSYTRFHGSKSPEVFTDFPDVVLQPFVDGSANAERDDFVFFLNDLEARAPRNAQRYAELVAKTRGVQPRALFAGFVPEWTHRKRTIESFFAPAKRTKVDEPEGALASPPSPKASPFKPLSARGAAAVSLSGKRGPQLKSDRKKKNSASLITSYFAKPKPGSGKQ